MTSSSPEQLAVSATAAVGPSALRDRGIRTRRRRSPTSAITPARIAAAERCRDALRLRRAGATYQQVADALGYADRSNARRDIMRALRTAAASMPNSEREDELLTELSRLDGMLEVLAPRVERGQLTAIDRVLKIMDRRAAYLGLDAPVRHAWSADPDGIPVLVASGADDVVRAAALQAITADQPPGAKV